VGFCGSYIYRLRQQKKKLLRWETERRPSAKSTLDQDDYQMIIKMIKSSKNLQKSSKSLAANFSTLRG